VPEYEQLTPHSQRLEKIRPPPGHLNSDGQKLIYGKQFGNFYRGTTYICYEGDPMRLLFSRSASPHHGFAAYYTYLSKSGKCSAALWHPRLWSSCPVSR